MSGGPPPAGGGGGGGVGQQWGARLGFKLPAAEKARLFEYCERNAKSYAVVLRDSVAHITRAAE